MTIYAKFAEFGSWINAEQVVRQVGYPRGVWKPGALDLRVVEPDETVLVCDQCAERIRYAPRATEWWHVDTGSRWCATFSKDPVLGQRASWGGWRPWLDDPIRCEVMWAEANALVEAAWHARVRGSR